VYTNNSTAGSPGDCNAVDCDGDASSNGNADKDTDDYSFAHMHIDTNSEAIAYTSRISTTRKTNCGMVQKSGELD
jgi:hypothetical protein